jgi:AraC-like DNA-binding protein
MLPDFALQLADPLFAELLFDRLPDVVFFIKDAASRYVAVNETLRVRCGCAAKADLLGRTTEELFPAELGASYARQDHEVIARGQPIADRLELHLYPDRAAGWCLTYKMPLFDRCGAVIGLAGVSRDLRVPDREDPHYRRIAAAIQHLHGHFGDALTIAELAGISGFSVAQFERHIHTIFGLTPKQLLIKTRLEAATRLLCGHDSVAAIAAACGYADHSAFSRQFRTVVGVSPREFRAMHELKTKLLPKQESDHQIA